MGARTYKPSYFGNCPKCNAEPEILNVGRDHFAVCRDHKIYWPIGSNLFSNWRNEEPEVWEENKSFLSICTQPAPKPKRPPMGTLGDCLQEAASYQPLGYTRIIGCSDSFWRDIPADKPNEPWIVLDAVTAAIDPAPVTIHILAGTPAATAREILKQVSKWLKEHGDELPSLTPREPERTVDDGELVPF